MSQIITILAIFSIACSPKLPTAHRSTEDSGPSSTDTSTPDNDDTAFPAETIQLSLSLSAHCGICGIATITQTEPGPITVWMGEEGTALAPWVTVEADTAGEISLLELHADTAYTVIAKRSDDSELQSDSQTFTTAPLPADFPPLVLTVPATTGVQPGITVMTLIEWVSPSAMHSNFLVAVDEDGRVIWYHRLHGLNLGLHIDESRRIYTTQSVTQALRVDPFARRQTTWNAEDLGLDTTHHEIRPLPDDGLAVLSTELRTVPGWHHEATGWTVSFDIIGDIFATFDAFGHMTWSWSLLDHIDPIAHHTPDVHMTFWMMPPYDDVLAPKDWSHGNALVPNGGSWLGSFRNLDWLIQVDPDTDEIEWIFGPGGDFELAEGGRWFSRQHSPAVQPGGSILLYDNGNVRADRAPGDQPYSRVVEYQLDHETGVATELWSWDGGSTRTYSPIVGDVDILENDNYLITDGAIYAGIFDTEDELHSHFSGRVREIAGTEDPEIIWELVIGTPDDIEAPSWVVYRSIRTDSLYPSHVRPH